MCVQVGPSFEEESAEMSKTYTTGRHVSIEKLLASPESTQTTVRGRGGVRGTPKRKKFEWRIERGGSRNFRLCGERLASANPNLFRNGSDGHGIVQVLPSEKTRLILKAADLAPVLIDNLTMLVTKDGKVVGEMPAAGTLNAMLKTERFLGQFRPVDRVVRTSIYLDDYSLVKPGYHDGGNGQRILYLGEEPATSDSMETINQFLDVMDFATPADRANTVGGALTLLLRHRWFGEKPVILVTATKSHAGKGTITEFIRGAVPKADILYESVDWPMQSQFQRQVSINADIGMICFDNVRLDSAGGRAKIIRSGFVESFVTSPELVLASPGAGTPLELKNEFVVAINTNDGSLSPDLLNRSLSIHLAPQGDVQDRQSPIGNPKLEFLPQHGQQIDAELRGMIERWKQAGCPLDDAVKHPMSRWAKTIGGILKASGIEGFLSNYGTRKTADDPIREAIAILGAAKPGKELRPKEWAKIAVEQGLAKTLFSPTERDTEKGRERCIGVVLRRHLEETFDAKTETKRLRLRLEGGNRRWTKGKNPHVRYVFGVLNEQDLRRKTNAENTIHLSCRTTGALPPSQSVRCSNAWFWRAHPAALGANPRPSRL